MNITLNDLLFAFSRALDFVEQDLLGIATNHSKRVANMSMRLCRAMGGSDSEIFDIASWAILHDNALTAYMQEYGKKNYAKLEGIKIHCELGEQNISGFPFLTESQGIILYHHENWDGSGYFGLKHDHIPLQAAIIRLADNIDLSLYLGAPREKFMQTIRKHTDERNGIIYAPLVVEAFKDTFTQQCVDEMTDDQIDFSLAQAMPMVGRRLSPQELLNICQIFAKIIDAKSNFTRNHSQGTARLAADMAKCYNFDDQHCYKIELAGLLHDIGKLATPITILEKNGPLTDEEHAIISKHPMLSLEILQDIQGLEDIAKWAGHHHERLNGSGYGNRLGANELEFESRLIACCDIYQALTENRPYRAAYTQAIAIMRDMVEGNLIDGDIVETMDTHLST